MQASPLVTRFAPSPTGRMHAGNIFAYLYTWLLARKNNGRIILRIEDLDSQRSRSVYATQIMKDFERLGLHWDGEAIFQSKRHDAYAKAYDALNKHAHIYPCFCSRSEIHASAPHVGETYVYAGTCAHIQKAEQQRRMSAYEKEAKTFSWRLETEDVSISFEDMLQGMQTFQLKRDCGDFVIKKSDESFAYHLAVVVDDATAGINTVVRGADLLSVTPQQIYLQKLLSLPHVQYVHVPVLMALDGHRIAKRHSDASLDQLLVTYKSVEAVLGHIAYIAGLIPFDEDASAQDLLASADLNAVCKVKEILWH